MSDMRTFGYLCPECGGRVTGARSVPALRANDAEIACPCGKSALHTAFDGENYRLTVPCGVCGKTHEALCPADRIEQGDVALSCAETGQFCCFIGEEGTVEKHLARAAVLAEKEKSQADGAQDAFSDSVIMYEVLSELKEIAAREDGITCRCGSRRYRMEIRRSAVDLICAECGGKLRIPAVTPDDLDDLCCRMKLVIPGRA
ncbi:MAG: hypothetical protein IKN53_06785 [Oscillibacter sp.]|nr:hypothetical protein [Oscillibacter sp.]